MSATRNLGQSTRARGSLQNRIPGIDAAQLAGTARERLKAVGQIRKACFETGFFCIDNLLRRSVHYPAVLEQMAAFFRLPASDPRKRSIDVSGRDNTNGWMPMYREPAYQPGTLANLESFDCGRPSRGTGDTTQRKNRWPEIAGFRDDVQAFWGELSVAGWSVLRGIAESVGLEPEFFCVRCDSQDLSTMRLLHYPPTDPATLDAGNVGIAAHTDFECMTFIMQTAPGLELMDVRGDWYDAPAGSDRVVVLLGDMLERWTNGHLKATGHRVRNRDFRRFSIVLFFAVNDGLDVAPLARFVADGGSGRYPPVSQRAHTASELARAEKYRDELAGET